MRAERDLTQLALMRAAFMDKPDAAQRMQREFERIIEGGDAPRVARAEGQSNMPLSAEEFQQWIASNTDQR